VVADGGLITRKVTSSYQEWGNIAMKLGEEQRLGGFRSFGGKGVGEGKWKA